MHLLNVLQCCFPLRNIYLYTCCSLPSESHQQFTVGTEGRGNTELIPESCVMRSKLCSLICGAPSHTRTDLKPSKEICLDTAKTNKSKNIFWNTTIYVYMRTQKIYGGTNLVRQSWVDLVLSLVFGRYYKLRAMVQNGAAVSIIA